MTGTAPFARLSLVNLTEWIIDWGQLGGPGYNGLRPERIDCVMESVNMAVSDMRYFNHIKPYIKQLQEMGATTFEAPQYGRVIVLPTGSGT